MGENKFNLRYVEFETSIRQLYGDFEEEVALSGDQCISYRLTN